MAALLGRLEEVSPKWTATFTAGAGEPDRTGYKALQRLIQQHGYDTVRSALEFALAQKMVPTGRSAYPLLAALCVSHPSTKEPR